MAMQAVTRAPAQAFNIVETTIGDIHAAYKAGTLTARQLVQMYLDRIAAYDKKGPAINAIISLNPDGAGRGRPARCRVQDVGLRRSAARHSRHHEGPGRHQGHADDARLGAVQGLHARPRLLRRRQAEKGRRRSSSARRRWASSAAATRTARCSARPATSTTWSARRAAPRAARAPASPPISAPSRSARRASRRSAGRRSGTASPACARPWGW